MKKTGIIIAIALLTSVSLFAQREYSTFSARISTFGQSFDRPSFELEFTKAYGVPAYQVRDYYAGVDHSWGDLSLAFEFSRFFDRPVVVILDSYRRYHSWDRVAYHYGAKYNSKKYKMLAKMMRDREKYWDRVHREHRKHYYAQQARYERDRDYRPRYDNDRYTATIAVNTIETMTATATTTAIKVGITKEKETMAMAKISLGKGIITEDGNLTPLL